MKPQFKSIPENLRLLSNHYPSIAEICRKMGINRQQFNKYLSGTTAPSVRNLRKIAEFFGVTESQLMLPHDEFIAHLSSGSLGFDQETQSGKLQKFLSSFMTDSPDDQANLKPYCGYYFCYNICSTWQDHVTKSVVRIFQDEGHSFWETYEPAFPESNQDVQATIVKQIGLVRFSAERILVNESSYYPANLTQGMTILHSSYRSKLQFLSGIYIQLPTSGMRVPYATRILLEYLGDVQNESTLKRQAGVYNKDDSEHISPIVLSKITNQLDNRYQVLLPVDI